MGSFMTKLGLIFLIPLLPLALLIDLLFGDLITGVKTTATVKFYEHKSLFLTLWND